MRTLGTLVLTLALAAPTASLAVGAPGPAGAAPGTARAAALRSAPLATAAAAPGDAVVGSRVIGRSVRGRAIRAVHLGERGATKVVLISGMHGNEAAPRQILQALENGSPISGVNLWVIPSYNPDGLARGTRANARGVDLNRNFPHRWADLDGSYESGSGPASEPETRAVMRFLRDVRPSRVLSFHQPLLGVDKDTKTPSYSRRVADRLDLPRKAFTCGGVCHGTMVGWFNKSFRGTAITAEYGAHPTTRRMRVVAPRQVLSIWGATR
jgi:predicted deacylase